MQIEHLMDFIKKSFVYLYVPGRLTHLSENVVLQLYCPVRHSSMSSHRRVLKEYLYPDGQEGSLVKHSNPPSLFTQYWCKLSRQLCRFSEHSSMSKQVPLKARL